MSDLVSDVDKAFDLWLNENVPKTMFNMYPNMDHDQIRFLMKHSFVRGMLFGIKLPKKDSASQ